MSLAIKKAIVEGKDLVETMVAVGREYPFCDYGGRFYNWINGENHEPYGSWGNGSAMRVSFVGEYYEDYEEILSAAKSMRLLSVRTLRQNS